MRLCTHLARNNKYSHNRCRAVKEGMDHVSIGYTYNKKKVLVFLFNKEQVQLLLENLMRHGSHMSLEMFASVMLHDLYLQY